MDTSLSPSDRAQLLLAAMTQDEKIRMVHGVSDQPTPVATVQNGGTYSFANGLTSHTVASTAIKLGSCIDVRAASADNGALVGEWGTCGNSGAELFRAEAAGGGAFTFVNVGAGKCLSVIGAETANKTALEIRDCNGGAEQAFKLTPLGDGFAIVNTGSGRCVDVAAANVTNGTPIDIYDCYQPNLAQLWFAYSGLNAGNVWANERLGIPALRLEDGPAGVGEQVGGVTQFPAPLLIAATWDAALANQFGAAVGLEHAQKGDNVVLGPTMNMLRVPQDGRAFEGLGEDPFLASQIVAAITSGVQSQGVIATIKHLLDNDQETSRGDTDAIVDTRTQHEIQMPPYKAAVAAGVGAAMCSYNLINGTHACESGPVQNQLLKNELGFRGFIMSDWWATHSTVASALGGLDMEMPDSPYFGDALQKAIAAGQVPQIRLDDMVSRIAMSMFQAGLFDRPPRGSLGDNVASDAHATLARRAASEGTVLLKNEASLLPFTTARVHSIAVIGDAASNSPVTVGGGSGWVRAPHIVTPLQGIRARAPASMTVDYSSSSLATATALAAKSDVSVVVLGLSSGEGTDRPDLSLPPGSDDLVRAVAGVSAKTIVVVYAPAQVLMPWANDVASILFGFLPGQEEGGALASILFGDVNPSAKLPMTIAAAASDYPAHDPDQFPGEPMGNNAYKAHYTEGFLMGYRHFDSASIVPLYPFGHGLSYTTFDYAHGAASASSIRANEELTIELDLTNTGSLAGAEVVQLYLALPTETSEPPSQLVGFQKVALAPQATSHVRFTLHPESYSFWSAGLGSRVPYPGTHRFMIGSSSRDIRLDGTFVVTGGPLDGDIYQAEDAVTEGGASISTTQTGFIGAGFVSGYSSVGAATRFTITVPEAGRYPITVRYSAATRDQTLSLASNGTKVGQIMFPYLANLMTWDFVTKVVDLDAGPNTITYGFDAGDTGDVNLDALIVGSRVVAQTADGGADGSVEAGSPCIVASCGSLDASCGSDACEGAKAAPPSSGCACRVVTGRSRPSRELLGSALLVAIAVQRRRGRAQKRMGGSI